MKNDNKAKTLLIKFAEELAASTDRAKEDPKLLEYLAFCARFHRYSFHNSMLIFGQRPDATHVAGFQAWKKMGRLVKKGEKGICILAPIRVKAKDDEEDEDQRKVFMAFRAVYVFDVSQTEGDDLPDDPVLTGQKCSDALVLGLMDFAEGQEIEVVSDSLVGGAYGASSGGKIVLDSALQGADKFAVLAHELAHEMLHHKGEKPDKKIREIQAEMAAHIVCTHFGIPTTAPRYLALYGASGKEILAQLEPVVGVIQTLIAALEACPIDQAVNA